MEVGFSALNQVERLTKKELPLLSPDEWVDIKQYRSFSKDATAQRLARREVEKDTPRKIRLRDDEEDEELHEEPESQLYFIDEGEYLKLQFEYMAVDWLIHDPADKKGARKPIKFNSENRRLFVDLMGAHLLGQLLIRGGGIAPDMSGKVDPDTGEPLTFPTDT